MKHANASPEMVGIFRVIRELLREDRLRAAFLAIGMVISSLLEGFGVMTLILAVQIVTGDLSTVDGGVLAGIITALDWIGLGTNLGPVLFATVVLVLGKTLIHFSIISFGEYLAADIQARARQRMIRATLNAKYSFFLKHRVGRFVNALSTEVSSVAGLFVLICRSATTMVNVVVYLGVAVALSVKISIGAMFVAVLMTFVFSSLVGITRRTAEATTALNKAFITRLTDGLGGIKTLKVMGRESFLGPHLESEVLQLRKEQIKGQIAKQILIDSREPFIVLFLSIGLYLAIDRLGAQVSVLAGLALIFHRLINSVGQFQALCQSIVSLVPPYQSFKLILDAAQRESESVRSFQSDLVLDRSIELRNICFGYNRKSLMVKDLSLEIPARQLTLLIGPSGAGKTTILDLVCGLYEPQSGEICLDGIPLVSGSSSEYRERVGYVAQESVLFHDTIRNNLTLGDDSISESDIEQALVSAKAWEFVAALPRAVDQVIGEDGVNFSGGEKQRLALARALVRSPLLLVLDEVTSALDPSNEEKIIEVLGGLKESVTILAVSHQSALKNVADRVYNIDNGEAREINQE